MSSILSPRSHEGSRRPVLRALSAASERREPPANGPDATEQRRPALRVVPNAGCEAASNLAPVLLAGADAGGRAVLRAEFGATLPPRTRWVEAYDVAGVLERAAYSRMVIVAGDLDDAGAKFLMRLLGRRHPELPVICVDDPMPAVAGAHG